MGAGTMWRRGMAFRCVGLCLGWLLHAACAVAVLQESDPEEARAGLRLRRLMEGGSYGRLESVIPPITVPAWMCMATSQDPGSLGVYGFRNRTGYSYDALGTVNSRSIAAKAVWDVLGEAGLRTVIVGVPVTLL